MSYGEEDRQDSLNDKGKQLHNLFEWRLLLHPDGPQERACLEV